MQLPKGTPTTTSEATIRKGAKGQPQKDVDGYLKLEIEKGNVDPATFMKDINTKDLKI